MEREGLGRGIDDISHLFLSARAKRMAAEATSPKTAASGPAGTEVWPVIRVGQAERSAAEAWSVAHRLESPGQWVLHLAIAPDGTEVRTCGEPAPAEDPGPAAAIARARAIVADLTAAGDAARERVIESAGRLVLVTGTTEADTLAAYSLLKHAGRIPAGAAVNVEVAGPAEAAAQAFARLASAARHFLGRTLCDWRDTAPGESGDSMPGVRPEPGDNRHMLSPDSRPLPLLGTWPTDEVLDRLAEAASGAPRPGESPRPSVARLESARLSVLQPEPPPVPPPSAAKPTETLRPLVSWPDPDIGQLADFIERHPHLVQPGLTVVDRGLHDAGEGVVDLLAVDEAGRAAVILVAVSGGADLLAAALAYGRWCLREARLLARLDPRLRLTAATPPRAVLAACWFDEGVAEAVRMVNRPAVSLVELRAYDLAGEHGVAIARVA